MILHLSPRAEAQLTALARQTGDDPADVVEGLLSERSATLAQTSFEQLPTTLTDPLLARIEARLAAAPTDPSAKREAEEDLQAMKRNMNTWRKEAGARLLFPEAE